MERRLAIDIDRSSLGGLIHMESLKPGHRPGKFGAFNNYRQPHL